MIRKFILAFCILFAICLILILIIKIGVYFGLIDFYKDHRTYTDINIWHDTKKVIPQIKSNLNSYDVISDKGELVYYSYRDNQWYNYDGFKVDSPKKWCCKPNDMSDGE